MLLSIDESVTTDVHRVFRMPGTLHGTSGMLKMRVEFARRLRPAGHSRSSSETRAVKVNIDYAPEFYLKGKRFGPYDSASVAATHLRGGFLLARGLGGVAA